MEQTDILQEIQGIQQQALDVLQAVEDEKALEAWRVSHLGRSSAVMQVFSQISKVPAELRPQVGQEANKVKVALEDAFQQKSDGIKQAALEHTLKSDVLDVTMPGRRPLRSGIHPANQTLRKIYKIFGDMGFQVYRSREVETDAFTFEYLNMPPYHPARDMWDTFYTTEEDVVLRTHTSPGQIHVMRENAPEPVRAILPGMCYRYEQISARSEIQFNQVELIAIGKDITFGDLKGTLQDFVNRLFAREVRTRFRPNHFPFTEPSAEMDVECFVCGGQGCPVCKHAGWLEILGCGMVHPVVMQNGGYDPNVYTGFAAGMGPERITMLLNKIEDIRYFWSNDIRFLEQF
ncbi:MAG: phenylalanine--tRNA ligase subunit alpha [Anaerolineaceae bacterium]|nr:phenylalanine--tRNA ligase subunit alpha [Anaerolineaceae bacterium]